MQVSFKSIPRHTVRLQNAQSKCFHFTLQYIFKMTNTLYGIPSQDGKITLLDILYKVIVIHIYHSYHESPTWFCPLIILSQKSDFPFRFFLTLDCCHWLSPCQVFTSRYTLWFWVSVMGKIGQAELTQFG